MHSFHFRDNSHQNKSLYQHVLPCKFGYCLFGYNLIKMYSLIGFLCHYDSMWRMDVRDRILTVLKTRLQILLMN